MFRHIDPRSPVPLYAQIADRVRIAVATGDLAPGTALPSVRQLAAQLRVNPATVVQAYRELEEVGVVESRQGAGTFVRALAEPKREAERQREARRLVRRLLRDAAALGVTREDLDQALKAELKGRAT
ncbi:MAG TPA: GntR family transcriptional regulator [Gemmatimonadales bacterium]|nr:GntR family transcriptional regulator [Gemmatimonadales bacterium]